MNKIHQRPYIQALTQITEEELTPIVTIKMQSKMNRKRRPQGFRNLVRKFLGNVKISNSHIENVKRGVRRNDAVLLAIIQADHALTHSKDTEELLYSLIR